jgi:alkylated DNA repair dioxygenase AlkB
MTLDDFTNIPLDSDHGVRLGTLPPHLRLTPIEFQALWALHPEHFHQVRMFGRLVPVPRWSQSYGRDYHYSGTLHAALPMPDVLAPLLVWSTAHIDKQLNGLLVNWYDGALGHKIGPHRDNEPELIVGAPIVTISFGEARTFRLRSLMDRKVHDIEVTDGSVLILPHTTNLAFTHEVAASKRRQGRRTSITIRAFSRATAR